MAYNETKSDLIINKMTKAKYEELLAAGQISDTEIYYITDDNDKFYLKSQVYTKQEVAILLANKVSSGDLQSLLNAKQDSLIAGINIKTINGESILGSGNIEVALAGPEGGHEVIANPELTGEEEKLRGITINAQTYSVMAAEMSFSDVPVESELRLANIQIGQDNWSIVSEALVNQKINQNLIDSKAYVDTKVAELIDAAPETLNTLGEIASLLTENDTMIDTLNAAVGIKANAEDVYTKTETDGKYLTIPELDANPIVYESNPRLTSLRVKGIDYNVLPEAAMIFTGTVDEYGTKTLTKLSCNADVWNLPDMRQYYLKTEVDNLIAGLLETINGLEARITLLEEK